VVFPYLLALKLFDFPPERISFRDDLAKFLGEFDRKFDASRVFGVAKNNVRVKSGKA